MFKDVKEYTVNKRNELNLLNLNLYSSCSNNWSFEWSKWRAGSPQINFWYIKRVSRILFFLLALIESLYDAKNQLLYSFYTPSRVFSILNPLKDWFLYL